MKIGLIDVDSHNFPNIPLMKLSAYHKNKGDSVEFATMDNSYDRVYVSKIFTESKEPEIPECKELLKGGSGYNLKSKLPYEVEHTYPDYSLYPTLTENTAYGMLTRGCPRCNHTFCITPKKDGRISKKTADLSEFWHGQANICLLDQNILACKESDDLFKQLIESKAKIEFKGGLDIRFIDEKNIELFRQIKCENYWFAWDDPKEDLTNKFQLFKDANIMNPNDITVYVLTNYWSTIEEDLHRIYTLRSMGYMPYVMVYDKQKFVNSRGRWIPKVGYFYTKEQLLHFKTCQLMQRWANDRYIINSCPDFNDYEWYIKWLEKGQPVPN